MATSCTHVDQIVYSEPVGTVAGCPKCIALGDTWVHLRMCQICGEIGCCDSSPNQHATAHHRETHHPVVRSIEPGEDWSWCYEDQLMFRVNRG